MTERRKRIVTVLNIPDVYCAYYTQQAPPDKQSTNAAHVSSLCAMEMRAPFREVFMLLQHPFSALGHAKIVRELPKATSVRCTMPCLVTSLVKGQRRDETAKSAGPEDCHIYDTTPRAHRLVSQTYHSLRWPTGGGASTS